jgi:hypothetical protein
VATAALALPAPSENRKRRRFRLVEGDGFAEGVPESGRAEYECMLTSTV